MKSKMIAVREFPEFAEHLSNFEPVYNDEVIKIKQKIADIFEKSHGELENYIKSKKYQNAEQVISDMYKLAAENNYKEVQKFLPMVPALSTIFDYDWLKRDRLKRVVYTSVPSLVFAAERTLMIEKPLSEQWQDMYEFHSSLPLIRAANLTRIISKSNK